MRGILILKQAAVILATLGIVFPQARILAGEPQAKLQPTIKIVSPNSIFDIKLAKGGEFTGRVVNHNGNPVIGTSVVVKQGKLEVGQALTDQQGNFAVRNLKSGLYEVQSSTTVGTYRIWSEKTAPPSAMPHGLLVLGENGARGQYGVSSTIFGENLGIILLASATAIGVAALIVGLHALNVANDAKTLAKKALASL